MEWFNSGFIPVDDNKKKYFQRIDSCHASLWKDNGPSLTMLDMELTERCDNNCIHCYINLPADDVAAKEKELSTSEVKGILEEAASLGCLTVRFTGGEPLLREDFEEIYIFARRLGFKVGLFTSATLVTPHLAQLFFRIPPLQKIEITVYGMKQRSYEAVTRSPGSFEAAMGGINLLHEKEVPFMVKFALLPPNKNEIDEFEIWASTLPWADGQPSYAMFFDFRCRRDSDEKNRLIKKLRPAPEEGLDALTRNREGYLKGMKLFCSRFLGPPGKKLLSCSSGTGDGCVDAYGKFQPCMLLRHPATIYDLKEGSLKDAITNFFPKIREMEAANPSYLARCAKCFLMGLCEQCPAKSWMEHGTMDTPVEYLCEVAHTQARYLGLLDAGEKAWQVDNWEKRVAILSSGEKA